MHSDVQLGYIKVLNEPFIFIHFEAENLKKRGDLNFIKISLVIIN